MRPMSMREMHALCYERGIEFDPGLVPNELVELTQVTLACPVVGRALCGTGAIRAACC